MGFGFTPSQDQVMMAFFIASFVGALTNTPLQAFMYFLFIQLNVIFTASPLTEDQYYVSTLYYIIVSVLNVYFRFLRKQTRA